jgi:hypothetical protein
MRVPVWIKPAVWGAVFGAVAIMIVGFSWMGWNLGHTTKRLVAEGSESAVIAALTPFCVANYMKQPEAAKQLAWLREDTSSYTQRDLIEKAGFATMPGNKEPTSGLAAACEIALRTASVGGAQPLAEAKTVTK